jgi:phage gpG-like protein
MLANGFGFEVTFEGIPRILEAFDRLLLTTDHLLKDNGGEFIRRCASIMADMIKNGIATEKYAHSGFGGYGSYSELYIKWKKDQGLDKGWLQLRGDLLESITFFPFNKGWMAGVPRGTTGQDGRPVALRGVAHEFGSEKEKIPARPFIRPAMVDFINQEWPKIKHEPVEKLKDAWR